VITVSNNTKKDLMRLYNVPEEKIKVIYNGVDDYFSPRRILSDSTRVRGIYQLHQPYVLAMGGASPRKNISRLIEAFGAVRQDDAKKVQLVIIGSLDEEAAKKAAARSDVRVLGHVPIEDLAALYSAALCFVYPSLYEGFGLPVLEAMACGAAVACANASSLPEVAGDAALYFSPLSVAEMAQALRVMIKDKAKREFFSKQGPARANLFSWKKAAAETLQVYHSLLERVPA
jgi:glycosyltransferase involved in cell wall biosynthesis